MCFAQRKVNKKSSMDQWMVRFAAKYSLQEMHLASTILRDVMKAEYLAHNPRPHICFLWLIFDSSKSQLIGIRSQRCLIARTSFIHNSLSTIIIIQNNSQPVTVFLFQFLFALGDTSSARSTIMITTTYMNAVIIYASIILSIGSLLTLKLHRSW